MSGQLSESAESPSSQTILTDPFPNEINVKSFKFTHGNSRNLRHNLKISELQQFAVGSIMTHQAASRLKSRRYLPACRRTGITRADRTTTCMWRLFLRDLRCDVTRSSHDIASSIAAATGGNSCEVSHNNNTSSSGSLYSPGHKYSIYMYRFMTVARGINRKSQQHFLARRNKNIL